MTTEEHKKQPLVSHHPAKICWSDINDIYTSMIYRFRFLDVNVFEDSALC
jgi:hypothetical protein